MYYPTQESTLLFTWTKHALEEFHREFVREAKIELEELEVQEVNVSSAVLKVAAYHCGSQCDKPNKEFMLCCWKEMDPQKYLKEGKEMNKCALDPGPPGTLYWTCINYTSLLELQHCQKQQQAFDKYVLDKLGWVRPKVGQLSKVTKVKTNRPIPENPYHSWERLSPNPPVEGELKPTKYRSQMFFWSW
uniref:Uncharacterized protein n=1 Tax=Anolis carolinensis TaxID=28377 RepID=A0A803T144_ANOCA